jgi:hypothetical protein
MVVSGCKVLRGCVVRRICNSRTEGVLVLSREVDFGRSRKQTRLAVGGEIMPRAVFSLRLHSIFMSAQLLSLSTVILSHDTANLTPLDADWEDS